MSIVKSSLLFLSLTAVSISSAQFTDVINSNRPGESMAAFSVGQTVFQAETGIYGVKEEHKDLDYESDGYGIDLSLRYGAFYEQLEFILDLQYQRDNYQTSTFDDQRNGLRQATIGGKFLIYDPHKNYQKKPNLYSWKANHKFVWRDFIPAIGVYGGLNFNLFDNPYAYPHEEKVSPKLMILAQNQFGRWVLVTNLYADKMLTNFMAYGYIITVTRGFNDRWSGFIENQGIKSDQYSDGIFRLGAAYLIKENIQVDASLGANLKSTPSILNAGIGLSWRFDENYNEVILRAPKDEKDSKQDKEKKKKKDKAKKRLDEIEETPVK